MPPSTPKDYNWKKSVIEISKYVFTILKLTIKRNYLRGSLISIEMIGNDLYLEVEENTESDDDYLTKLQESRQEYLQRIQTK
eukprot:gene16137-18248_t